MSRLITKLLKNDKNYKMLHRQRLTSGRNEKVDSWHVFAILKKFQFYLKITTFCEYVKFWRISISWKIAILSITA